MTRQTSSSPWTIPVQKSRGIIFAAEMIGSWSNSGSTTSTPRINGRQKNRSSEYLRTHGNTLWMNGSRSQRRKYSGVPGRPPGRRSQRLLMTTLRLLTKSYLLLMNPVRAPPGSIVTRHENIRLRYARLACGSPSRPISSPSRRRAAFLGGRRNPRNKSWPCVGSAAIGPPCKSLFFLDRRHGLSLF